MRYTHVDVFTGRPYDGNSLAVFPEADALTAAQMLGITREMRHFESVFLARDPARPRTYRARVFDLAGELDFAGHPLIGAAGVLHAGHAAQDDLTWTLRLRARTVEVATRRTGPLRYESTLDQGPAEFPGGPCDAGAATPAEIAAWFALDADDLDPDLPPLTVSTGLRYLVVPVRGDALARARVATPLDGPLGRVGAGYAYLLDATAMEGRHWTNDGALEDTATGSGAGCAAAYLRRYGRIGDGEPAVLRQGRFTGRTGEMSVTAYGHGDQVRSVKVGGGVAIVAEGVLAALP
ncbi:PhzF family phenazine biosynthesis protein [Streptomyces sp. NBC_00249]|uniref:PhzF family phenazine biosynthesis protein n=1 Tax=Streptomyces sp. NBC_00249 TaxID=2975690 RepID=UPI0022549ED9|nr:PhzF family phenazine biosynthesis protein [Streptomyces sp. NBC_00249]MCX5192454.1 PhzF family phenazine biosynthesis protein [Streptomyces sp. NBC_00249]